MASLSIIKKFIAKQGTKKIRSKLYRVEYCLYGVVKFDFIENYDYSDLNNKLNPIIMKLKNRHLDNIVGRATHENIARYIIYKLKDTTMTFSIRVSDNNTNVIIYNNELNEIEYEDILLNSLGISFYLRKKYKSALKCFYKVKNYESNKQAVLGIIRTQIKLAAFKAALSSADKAIAIWSECGELYRNKGNILLFMKKYDEMLKSFNKAIKLMPESALAWNNRGYAYQVLGMYGKALNDHDMAIKLNPEYSEAYLDKANSLLKSGEIKKAKEAKGKGIYYKKGIDHIEIERVKIVAIVNDFA